MRRWKRALPMLAACVLLLAPPLDGLADAQARGRSSGARQGVFSRQLPLAYEEPAFARGYEDGHGHGLADGRRRQRYDPVASRDYRSGDRGYSRSYGSRDAYRNNYRTGFRLGYEQGYRDGTR